MIVTSRQDTCLNCNAFIIPFTSERKLSVALPDDIKAVVTAALEENTQIGSCKGMYAVSIFRNNQLLHIVLADFGTYGENTTREVFLSFARAVKKCKDLQAKKTVVLLDNAAPVTSQAELCAKLCEVPFLVAYSFTEYKSYPRESAMEEVEFVTSLEGFPALAAEATICAQSTIIARDLVNHPSMFMTPVQLCVEAKSVGDECGIEVEIFDKPQIEKLGMHTFLSVGRGAVDQPKLIVMRYRGEAEGEPILALIGKGVMFDSGGYSLKSKMATMHDDMGGAAAVIGAIRTVAKQKLPMNLVVIIAACKNMISGDAYVPGDILHSMNGKTIEMLNTDAEGRLTLVDAITYAIRKENAERIIDIATLTGAAKGAVGARSAAVISNDETLCSAILSATKPSCEKVWRLDADKELRSVLDSSVADIKSSNPGNTMGGGTIVASLFIQEFVEEKPWAHIDMASVNWMNDDTPICCKGGSGYGVSLLYQTIKELLRQSNQI